MQTRKLLIFIWSPFRECFRCKVVKSWQLVIFYLKLAACFASQQYRVIFWWMWFVKKTSVCEYRWPITNDLFKMRFFWYIIFDLFNQIVWLRMKIRLQDLISGIATSKSIKLILCIYFVLCIVTHICWNKSAWCTSTVTVVKVRF